MNHNSKIAKSMFLISNGIKLDDLSSPPSPFLSYQNSHVSSSSLPFHISHMTCSPFTNFQNSHVTSSTLPFHNSHMSCPPFSRYQNSHVSSSSSPFHNSHMNHHVMRRNIESLFGVEHFSIRHNPHLTQVSFTQTITTRYTSIGPTNTLGTVPYDIQSAKYAMDSKPNIRNPLSQRSIFLNNNTQILNPTPLNIIYPGQDSADPQHSDIFSLSSSLNHVPQTSRSMNEIPQPTSSFQKGNFDIDSENDDDDNDEYDDGITHSIPCEKYGPYTCPKCSGVFDTSQKFASHMSIHYKSETNKKRVQRLRARHERKYRKLRKNLAKPYKGSN